MRRQTLFWVGLALLLALLLVYAVKWPDLGEATVLNNPPRGIHADLNDAPYDDIWELIEWMRGKDVSFDEWNRMLERYASVHGIKLRNLTEITAFDYSMYLLSAVGLKPLGSSDSPSPLHLSVLGYWDEDGYMNLLAIGKWDKPYDTDDSPDYIGFRWWDGVMAPDRAVGYVHMKYIKGTKVPPKAYFMGPIPSVGLPVSAYYASFQERYVVKTTRWWGNYIVTTDEWYADWFVMYIRLRPLDDSECYGMAFDYVRSYMTTGFQLRFKEILGQLELIMDPPKGVTSYFVPIKVCRGR
jgi:hypothetical protein